MINFSFLNNSQLRQKNIYKVPIPVELDIPGMIKSDPIKKARFKNKPHIQADKAKYFLGQISIVLYMNKKKYPKGDEYIRLCSEILRRFDKRYHYYFKYFEEKGVIEIDTSYQTDNYCKGYRFTEKYREQPIKMRGIYDEKFNQLIERNIKRKNLFNLNEHII